MAPSRPPTAAGSAVSLGGPDPRRASVASCRLHPLSPFGGEPSVREGPVCCGCAAVLREEQAGPELRRAPLPHRGSAAPLACTRSGGGPTPPRFPPTNRHTRPVCGDGTAVAGAPAPEAVQASTVLLLNKMVPAIYQCCSGLGSVCRRGEQRAGAAVLATPPPCRADVAEAALALQNVSPVPAGPARAVELPAPSPHAACCGVRCGRSGLATHPQDFRSSLLLKTGQAVPHSGWPSPSRMAGSCRLQAWGLPEAKSRPVPVDSRCAAAGPTRNFFLPPCSSQEPDATPNRMTCVSRTRRGYRL